MALVLVALSYHCILHLQCQQNNISLQLVILNIEDKSIPMHPIVPFYTEHNALTHHFVNCFHVHLSFFTVITSVTFHPFVVTVLSPVSYLIKLFSRELEVVF